MRFVLCATFLLCVLAHVLIIFMKIKMRLLVIDCGRETVEDGEGGERGGMCVCVASAAHFSWKRALIAISSNAHHGKDEVISPAPSLSRSTASAKNSQGIYCAGLGLELGPELRLVCSGLGWVFAWVKRESRICQSVNYSI